MSKAVEIAGRGAAALVDAHVQPAPIPAADVRAANRAQPAQSLDLELLVATHQDRLRRLAYRLLGWRGGEVDDVVQDVFLAALKHLPRFRGESSVSTWLTAITINRCRTAHRRRRLKRLLGWKSQIDPAEAWSRPADEEIAQRVREAVRALPPRDREVIVLRYFEQFTGADIAAATRQSPGAVEVRLHRARGRLATTLGPLIGEDKHDD